MLRVLLLLTLSAALGAPVVAQADAQRPAPLPRTFADLARQQGTEADPETAPMGYVVRAGEPLRRTPGGASVRALRLREGVRLLAEPRADGWRRVWHDGAEGWVRDEAVSDLWIRIDKSERTVYVYRGADLWKTMPADVSATPEGDKLRQAGRTETAEHKIPEGTFYVTRRFEESDYYLAFVLSYPTPVHALRGLDEGLISQREYEAIVRAHREFREPPQYTRLGGLIEIHGNGSGRRRAWTRGCIALRNVHMDDLWEVVHVGTPVVIEP
ncbi:MAG: L,D-transpeptidase family protein [Bacteroidota bacterium]